MLKNRTFTKYFKVHQQNYMLLLNFLKVIIFCKNILIIANKFSLLYNIYIFKL